MTHHFYTASYSEYQALIKPPTMNKFEGIVGYVRYTTPFYRLQRYINANDSAYYYTAKPFEGATTAYGGLPLYAPPSLAAYTRQGPICEVMPYPYLLSTPTVSDVPPPPITLLWQMSNPGISDYIYFNAGTPPPPASAGYADPQVACYVPTNDETSLPDLYQLYNPVTKKHYYAMENELPTAMGPLGFSENNGHAAKVLPLTFNSPFYRLYNASTGDHFYTLDLDELSNMVGFGYAFERVEGGLFSQPATGTTPLFRLVHPSANDHLYTTSNDERISAVAVGYVSEGIAGEIFTAQAPYTTALYRVLLA